MKDSIDFLLKINSTLKEGLYICLCTRRNKKRWGEHWFKTPLTYDVLEDFFTTFPTDLYDLYFCPHAFTKAERKKSFAVPTKYLWSDLDNANPKNVKPKPNIAWESSPNRYACLWVLDHTPSLDETEELNKKLAYANGADHGGWDITQVLRIPGTRNHKYTDAPRGKLLWDDLPPYHEIAPIEGYTGGVDEIFKKYNVSPFLIKKIYSEAQVGKRSEVLFKLENALLEIGMSKEEVFEVIKDSPWNKFSNRPKQLIREIERNSERVKILDKVKSSEPLPSTITNSKNYITLVPLEDVEAEQVEWLWYPYIPRGKLTIIEGDPGLGKSWLTMALASHIARGKKLPENDIPTPKGPVIILSAEDGLADTIKPRLVTLGSDCKNIYAIPEALTLNEAGVLALEKAANQIKPELIIIDPLVAYFGSKIDMHKANETRSIMKLISALAEEIHTAIVCVRHLAKGQRDKAIYRGIGSIDITAAARSCLAIGRNPEDPNNGRVICHIKSNLAPMGRPIAYELSPGAEEPFKFIGPISVDVNKVLNQEPTDVKGMIEEARDWLEDYLTANGPTSSETLHRECEGHGITWENLRKARKALKIQVTTDKDIITWSLMTNS